MKGGSRRKAALRDLPFPICSKVPSILALHILEHCAEDSPPRSVLSVSPSKIREKNQLGPRKRRGNLAWILALENPSHRVNALWVVCQRNHSEIGLPNWCGFWPEGGVDSVWMFWAGKKGLNIFGDFGTEFMTKWQRPSENALSTQGKGRMRKILGKRKHTLPCSSAELFFAEKMGPLRKDFGGGYGFLVFIGFLYPPPAWKVFLWGQKSSPKDFFLVVVVYLFSSLRICVSKKIS